MTIVVYSQLGELLRTRRLTVADLARQLRRRFGLTVNAKTLYRLTRPGPIRHANLAVTIATAAILGVALEDLFMMRTLPDDGDNIASVLDPVASRRLADLFDRRALRTLTADERDELDRLVLDYSGLARDRELRRFAVEHGLSIEQARDQVREQVGDIVARDLPRHRAARLDAMSGVGSAWLAACRSAACTVVAALPRSERYLCAQRRHDRWQHLGKGVARLLCLPKTKFDFILGRLNSDQVSAARSSLPIRHRRRAARLLHRRASSLVRIQQ